MISFADIDRRLVIALHSAQYNHVTLATLTLSHMLTNRLNKYILLITHLSQSNMLELHDRRHRTGVAWHECKVSNMCLTSGCVPLTEHCTEQGLSHSVTRLPGLDPLSGSAISHVKSGPSH